MKWTERTTVERREAIRRKSDKRDDVISKIKNVCLYAAIGIMASYFTTSYQINREAIRLSNGLNNARDFFYRQSCDAQNRVERERLSDIALSIELAANFVTGGQEDFNESYWLLRESYSGGQK